MHISYFRFTIDNCHLTIKNVTFNDANTYICNVENTMGNAFCKTKVRVFREGKTTYAHSYSEKSS